MSSALIEVAVEFLDQNRKTACVLVYKLGALKDRLTNFRIFLPVEIATSAKTNTERSEKKNINKF